MILKHAHKRNPACLTMPARGIFCTSSSSGPARISQKGEVIL